MGLRDRRRVVNVHLACSKIAVDDRDDKQREEGADQKATDNDEANVLAALRAGPRRDRQRHGAENHCAGRHQDRP